MKDAHELIPWQVTDISIRPYDGFWSFNPSIHFDGTTWRCVLRCCDYAMPNGATIRSKNARPTGQQTKNAMVILDPTSWKPVAIHKMEERDGHPRASTPHVGFEDMRLFRTDSRLHGIAASLHLRRDRSTNNQPPEQVLLSFDDVYNIVAARPIRGDWSGTPQKNWVPFDHCTEPRFLYSISKGTLFGDGGPVHGDVRVTRVEVLAPSAAPEAVSAAPEAQEAVPALPEAAPPEAVTVAPEVPLEAASTPTTPEASTPLAAPHVDAPSTRPKPVDRRTAIRGGDVKLIRGGRLSLDASTSRPSAVSRSIVGRAGYQATRGLAGGQSTRVLGTGRALPPKYAGLRGGTQLVRIGENAWLGIGHEMKFVNNKKYYWHVWYVVDSRGKLTVTSEPMKLAQQGIEFAAGMAIDGDRVVVSFGVDDMECKIGETRLSAVMGILRPVA